MLRQQNNPGLLKILMKEVRGMTGKLYEIPIKSITYAIKGQKLLERYGMVAYVGRDRTSYSFHSGDQMQGTRRIKALF